MNFFRHKHIVQFLLIMALTLFTSLKTYAVNVNYNNDLIRVGISDNSFAKLAYTSIKLSATGSLKIWDASQDTFLEVLPPNTEIQVTFKDNKYNIFHNGELIFDNLKGPLRFFTDKDQYIAISGLKRAGRPALYRGYFEISKAPGKNNSFSLINVLSLTSYLKGVVPNEMPVSFGLEALKSQTIAARNYAKRPRIFDYYNFDVCDSVACQVYFGANSEHTLSDKAIEDTNGLYALYNGNLILALYSSTPGGYTENYEDAFSIEGTSIFPAKPIPYLKGVPDDPKTPKLDTEAKVRTFYTSIPSTFDNGSRFFRWKRVWTKQEMENALKSGLRTYANSDYETPKLLNTSDFGTLKNIEVIQRGVSGKAMFVKITTDKGQWVIKKEIVIRRVFKNNGKALPSANFVIDIERNQNNDPVEIVFQGGGFGHGVGMSQYGAGCMASQGYKFDSILKHYYKNIAIGTLPVVFDEKSPITTVSRKFSTIDKKGKLIIRSTDNLSDYKIKINSKSVNLNSSTSQNGGKIIDVTGYLALSNNILEVQPPINKKRLDFRAWIEVRR